jgi:hypothetical protein
MQWIESDAGIGGDGTNAGIDRAEPRLARNRPDRLSRNP